MESSLILTLGISLLFAALLYYIFFIKQQSDIGEKGKSSFFVILVIIVPFLVMVLLSQSGAEQELKKYGFSPYPDFTGSVGIATGSGNPPNWLFSTDAKPASIIGFYKKSENHDDWILISETRNGLVFSRNNKKMSLKISDNYVLFTLFPE